MNTTQPIIKTRSAPILSILTGHTCGEACWHAKEEVCRCSCGGLNHGILNDGSIRPERTSKKNGDLYILAGVAPSYRDGAKLLREVLDVNFTGLDWCAYGNYRDAPTMPVLNGKASVSAMKWPEVQAVESTEYGGAKYLIWRRPAGSKYITQSSKAARSGATGTSSSYNRDYQPPLFAFST